MTKSTGARLRLIGVSAAALAVSLASGTALAETMPVIVSVFAETPDPKAASTPADADADAQKIAEGSDIVVTATKANEIAPVTASLQTTQPQSIVSRSFIEDSLPATADFNQIALISPSVSNTGGANGVGLSESKAQIRGFQDAEYNVTYDGVPFGDTNDPSHHSNTFFPSNTVETLIVDRGPGNASNLGQATFGGSLNMFSRATREDASVELKGSYGSYNTWLLRGLIQSGAIKGLGGTEIVVSGQHIKSDGARTFSPFKSNNVFGKIMVPLGPDATFTLLATYNENTFNQPDNDGATLSQVAQFGKYFSLNNDPNSQTYFGYNHTHKTTDFEIAKFEVTLAPWASFETRAYTYSYDNETLSGNDVTLYATDTAANIAKANVYTPVNGVATTAPGVPGYTKTNKYRVMGDISKAKVELGSFATATFGLWFDWADTYRQQRDVDLVTGARNYIEKKVTNPVSGAVTPQDIKFDQNSHTDHLEEFVEVEFRPFDGLKITPGFKHSEFTRIIDASYNQTTRYEQHLRKTYAADLPFLTINYQPMASLSVYAQYARGFLMPPLSQLYVANPSLSLVDPQKSTNYQVGAVYHGSHLSIDADAYYIAFKNKFSSTTSTVPGEGVIFTNLGGAIYKGVEGQVTYAFDGGFAVFANASRNYAKTNNATDVVHTQVSKAPEWTAAGGLLYKHGPMRFSLIDKYIGKQWFTAGQDPNYQSNGYNTAILSARYDIGPVRIGIEVNNIFDSKAVTNVSTGKTAPFDQYFYQTGRAYTGDITLTF
jgi:iron complex outermembrane receptor protein